MKKRRRKKRREASFEKGERTSFGKEGKSKEMKKLSSTDENGIFIRGKNDKESFFEKENKKCLFQER